MTALLSEEKIGGLCRVSIRPEENFDVAKIFDCGQSFRFERVENSLHEVEYSGIAFGRLVSFAQDGDTVYIYNSTAEDYENIWKRYLCLDVDYADIDRELLSLCDSAPFHEAIHYGNGIRILSQDPFEAIISFIISQNNNIPRIKQIVERLSLWCGEPVSYPEGMEAHLSGHSSLYSFPTAERLNSLGIDGLFEAKTGFRAKYIYDATERILSGDVDIDRLFELSSTAEGVEYLCKIKGVGPKVASCILLFACRRYDAFPVDVWIKKAMTRYFPDAEFSSDFFGQYAGIAQQYLFYYERYLGGEK